MTHQISEQQDPPLSSCNTTECVLDEDGSVQYFPKRKPHQSDRERALELQNFIANCDRKTALIVKQYNDRRVETIVVILEMIQEEEWELALYGKSVYKSDMDSLGGSYISMQMHRGFLPSDVNRSFLFYKDNPQLEASIREGDRWIDTLLIERDAIANVRKFVNAELTRLPLTSRLTILVRLHTHIQREELW